MTIDGTPRAGWIPVPQDAATAILYFAAGMEVDSRRRSLATAADSSSWNAAGRSS